MFDFQPEFIFPNELATFDLPQQSQVPNIMTLVDGASSMIDTYCGRIDAKGNGSLVYTSYAERILIPETRNIFRVAFAPMIPVDVSTKLQLTAMTAISGNHFDTGFFPSTINRLDGSLSSIIGLSGRYSYGRKSASQVFPDSQYAANILQVAAFFGGPPQFVPIDITLTDYYDDPGEVWCPAGLMMTSYTEVLIQYNAGFDPRLMPKNIKHATAALVKNFIARAGGITSVTSYAAGKIHVTFTEDLMDKNIERWLIPYRKVVAM